MERALGPELAEFYRLREAGLSRLEALTLRLVDETHDYRLRLDAEMAEQKQALSISVDKRTQELEANYGERAAHLDARARELQEQRQDLDDRSARHARREQSRALQQKISERSQRFTLTRETQRKRLPVHCIFVALLLVSGGLVAWTLLSPAAAASGIASWFELVRLPMGALGFALASIFYIRWNDQWFRQHADQEFSSPWQKAPLHSTGDASRLTALFLGRIWPICSLVTPCQPGASPVSVRRGVSPRAVRLQQLALDVDRAGYATEMPLEWQENKSGEMPGVLLDRLTTGLFTDQTTVARARHPTEDIAGALLKASSSVRLDLPGIGEVNLTGRQIRGLNRKLTKETDE